jgi:hypothetical protein
MSTVDGCLVEEKMRTEIISGCSPAILQEIVVLQNFFPAGLSYNPCQIESFLLNSDNIFLFVYKGSEVAGYIFGQPQNDMVKLIGGEDPLMKADDSCYYINQVLIKPSGRKSRTCLLALKAFFQEANRRGCFRYTAHVLTLNGFDKYIEIFMSRIIKAKRKISIPSFGNYEFTYMEAEGVLD